MLEAGVALVAFLVGAVVYLARRSSLDLRGAHASALVALERAHAGERAAAREALAQVLMLKGLPAHLAASREFAPSGMSWPAVDRAEAAAEKLRLESEGGPSRDELELEADQAEARRLAEQDPMRARYAAATEDEDEAAADVPEFETVQR